MTTIRLAGIRAVVFDAYGTLFDVNSAAARKADAIGNKWPALAELWRAKQLQYTWLRSLAGTYADFWQVTGDALDFALASLEIHDPDLRDRLMALYLRLGAYSEVNETLTRLKERALKLAILSNGSPPMLAAAVGNAGIGDLLDEVLSVADAGIYKPHRSVYQLAVDRLQVAPREICFVSSNGWDAFSAKAFGFSVVWCNRTAQPRERIPDAPDAEIATLAELPEIIAP